MKFSTTCLMLMISFSTSAITKEDAKQLIDFNEKSFSHKEIINSPELCSFHNSLIKISGTNKELVQCNGRNASPETKDQDLVKQMNEISQSMAVVEMVHPETEVSPTTVKDYAIQKMKQQGFGQ